MVEQILYIYEWDLTQKGGQLNEIEQKLRNSGK